MVNKSEAFVHDVCLLGDPHHVRATKDREACSMRGSESTGAGVSIPSTALWSITRTALSSITRTALEEARTLMKRSNNAGF